MIRMIYCCNCEADVPARLTTGAEVYPRRADLASLPFWRCDGCGHWVGCHHKTQGRTRPLGCIPSPAIKQARQHIHALIDPLWQSGAIKRSRLYGLIARRLGRKRYHTAEIRSLEEARAVYRAALAIQRELCRPSAPV